MTNEQIDKIWGGTELGNYRAFARAILAAQPAPTGEPVTTLGEIYAFLTSIAPKGIADEAFRNVPDSVLSYSERTRIVAEEPAERKDSGPVPILFGQNQGAGCGIDGLVTVSRETLQAAIDALVNCREGQKSNKQIAYALQLLEAALAQEEKK